MPTWPSRLIAKFISSSPAIDPIAAGSWGKPRFSAREGELHANHVVATMSSNRRVGKGRRPCPRGRARREVREGTLLRSFAPPYVAFAGTNGKIQETGARVRTIRRIVVEAATTPFSA